MTTKTMPTTAEWDALVERMTALCAAEPFVTTWSLQDLRDGGQAAALQGDLIVPSASVRKTAILMAALAQVHAGTLALDQPVVISERYIVNTSGPFRNFTPGFTITLRDALIMMIVVSDNAATGEVAERVGLDAVQELCQRLEMHGTTHRHLVPPKLTFDHPVEYTNATTANDQTLLLEAIVRGAQEAGAASILGSTPDLCQLALDILSWQELTNRLPWLLPYGVKVSHKTGRGARNWNDAGVVHDRDGQPLFALSVFTDQVPEVLPDGRAGRGAASLLIARLCREAWDALGPDRTSY